MALIIAALLFASISGAGARARHSNGAHYDYLGRLKNDDGTLATSTTSGVVRGKNPAAADVDPRHHKQGAHYDYLGRPIAGKTSGSVEVQPSGSAAPAAQSAPKPAKEDKTMETGFNGAVEDLPTIANPKQITVETTKTSSTVAKAGASGPSFHSDDSNEEHPNIVDKIQYDTQASSGGDAESGSNFSMFLILACFGGVIAWVKTSEQNRSLAKDKASSALGMVGPLVQEAMGAMGTVKDLSGSLNGHFKNASFHTRLFEQAPHQRDNTSGDDAELIADDDAIRRAMAMAESSYDDDSSQVPSLVQHAPALDLFNDSQPAPVPLDLLANDIGMQQNQQQTLDSLGLLDTDPDDFEL